MEISFTRLRVYLECPWQYKLRFTLGKDVPPTPRGALGLSIHRTLESHHRSGSDSLENLLDCYERSWVNPGPLPPEEEKRLRAKGRRILEKFYEGESARRVQLEGVEKEFIYPLGRHTVRGMIDRIDRHPDGGLEIIDYKALSDPIAAEDVAMDLQLRFYALGAREALGLEPVSIAIYFLSAGALVSAAYDPAGEAGLKRLIACAADLIELGEFKADTAFCPRCPYRSDCEFSTSR